MKRLAQKLREAPAAIHRDAERRVKAAVERQLEAQFATSTDPMGRPYLPPKDGHSPPMTRSGRLRRGMRVVVVSGPDILRISVMSDRDYAKYLQHGTRKMAARLITPGSSLLSYKWREVVQRAHMEAVRAYFSGP